MTYILLSPWMHKIALSLLKQTYRYIFRLQAHVMVITLIFDGDHINIWWYLHYFPRDHLMKIIQLSPHDAPEVISIWSIHILIPGWYTIRIIFLHQQ